MEREISHRVFILASARPDLFFSQAAETSFDSRRQLPQRFRGLLEEQRKQILLNLADVDCIDSSGIGELVSGFTAVKNQGGDLKLLQLTKKVRDLLQITKLYTVFEVFTDEASAVGSFQAV